MVFTSLVFLFAYLPVVLLVYYLVLKKSRAAQNLFLFFCSMFFYAWGEPTFSIVLLMSIIANWAFAFWIDKLRSNTLMTKMILVIMLFSNLGLLFVYKYLVFSLKTLGIVISFESQIPQNALPIGISFFTFQAISYVIDVYRKKGKVQKNPLWVGLYISFFPQLIAGPIVRYSTIAEQIECRKETVEDFAYGIRRFMIGFIKKVLVANTMATIADTAFTAPYTSLDASFAWLGVIAYTFQIYYDFSGYSDMAIGLGKMFGFHFEENFNLPYSATSITGFWRKWHISLGTWFRDYVYFPLGGSRVSSKLKLVLNLLIVWLLTGIWHGANFTFVAWGLMFFILLVIEKMTIFKSMLDKHPFWGWTYTMFFVIMGWVVFRSNSIRSAVEYIGIMFGSNGHILSGRTSVYLFENLVFFVAACIFSFPIWKVVYRFTMRYPHIINVVYPIVLIIAFIISILYIINNAYNPFIYFNF